MSVTRGKPAGRNAGKVTKSAKSAKSAENGVASVKAKEAAPKSRPKADAATALNPVVEAGPGCQGTEGSRDSQSVIDAIDELSLRLGQRVRSARAARAMTMKQLAEESGISLPYLSRVEKGDGNISISVLYRLATALSLPLENLLSGNERHGADYALIVELLKRQSHEQLSEIRQWLAGYTSAHGGMEVSAQPLRIALIGLRGAGKSTLGPLLARQLGIPFVELNREIEKEAGINLKEIFWLYGQAGYRRLERRCLERVIATCPQVVLATGGGIVAEPSTYELLLHSFYNVWLQADADDHFARVMAQHDARIASPQLQKEAMENIHYTLEARAALYELAHARISTSGKTVEQTLKELQRLFVTKKAA
ncbi:helix-turn-helix transcriptional regulator [Noviherbaspirillum aerium]|uniref:helix-turn-helix transcriptional regulator n=1 Tax=Noviherbaspirillum aerium TaxID=2588497 RepID=UPI00124F0DF4|nr:helix-turn-helix transcriptional regulator [Noviherbaspirillum aerium]